MGLFSNIGASMSSSSFVGINKNYNNYYDKEFIGSLNPKSKIEYEIRHSTLLNNVVFIAAQVINESLKKDVFNYKEDVFSHNFFTESGVNPFVNGIFIEHKHVNSVEEIKSIAIERLKKMQDYLENFCKKIIKSKKDLLLKSDNITPLLLYNLYNNGNCLPAEYSDIESKVLNYFGIDFNNLTDTMIDDIQSNLSLVVNDFGIPELGVYLDGYRDEILKNIYESEFGDFNPLKLLFDNLDLMAENLTSYCLIQIITLVSKKPVPVTDVKEDSNKLEIFFKNDLIPEGFSKNEEKLYNKCIELWNSGYLVFDDAGQIKLTDKFTKMIYDGNYKELAGVSFLRSDIEKFLFNSDNAIQFTGDIEQIVFSDYLDCDFKRAGIDRYDMKLLEDAGRGHWELWDYNGNVNEENVIELSKPLVARNPMADIHWDGVVGIDFGTKSTVVVYQDGDAHMYPMRVGSGNYRKEVRVTDYENPTVMQFINLGRFMEMYKAKEGRPDTLWEDVNISHTAAEALKTASSEKFYSFFSDLKQWCGDKNRQVRIRDTKGVERTLPVFTEMEEGGFDPIELYAYFLGLFINNMHRGIFLDYILSFPVTYEKAVRDKILKSFQDGLWKSLPVQVHNDDEVLKKFRVAQGASEPAAYAACALKEYGFNPDEGEKVLYGIFDFGGGTTDFDFGLWRTPENDRERRRYDYVIEHFGASGDQYLGGENLLELLAFSIFKNNHSKLREADISFTRPHGCENFPGSESLVKESQEAKLNTKQLMETVRGLWEHNNPEQIKNIESGAVKVNLFSNKGERVQNFELKTDKAELEGILRDRIKEGVDNFFNALKLNFARNDVAECDCVNIFLAGNSSKSPVVWQLFEEQIKERTDDLNKKRADKGEETDAGHLYYKIFPPLGVTEEDIKGQAVSAVKVEGAIKKADGNNAGVKKSSPSKNTLELKPTGKTGVAYGLLLCRKGGKIKDVPEKKQDEEAKFKYYLGCEVKGKFNTIVNTSIKYGQWVLFIDASVDEFDIYYTSSPNCTTNQLDIDAGSVFLKKCSIKEENEEADIYIRTVAPTVVEYVVATEEGIKQQEYIEEPVRVELG